MQTKLLVCLLCLLSSLAWGNGQSVQQLSELSSRSQLLCASALLYFNPQERSPDPRSLTAVFYHLQTLETTVLHLGQPAALAQPLRAMQRLFRELDGLPQSQGQRYPELIQQLLVQNRQLLQAAAELQAQLSSTAAGALPPFNAQSQALASLLLDFQLRHYPLPDKAKFTLSPEQLQALDKAIVQRFDRLLASHAEHAAVLRKVKANYQFVRAELQHRTGQVHGGAEFYLSRAVIDLDELALAARVAGDESAAAVTAKADPARQSAN